jgi:hypothetical protein
MMRLVKFIDNSRSGDELATVRSHIPLGGVGFDIVSFKLTVEGLSLLLGLDETVG